jgi:hypothetical protein
MGASAACRGLSPQALTDEAATPAITSAAPRPAMRAALLPNWMRANQTRPARQSAVATKKFSWLESDISNG